jgi:Rieske Fe-S protein
MTKTSGPERPTSGGVSRRHALTGAAGLGLALPLLAACGSSGASTNGGSGGSAASGGSGGSGGAKAGGVLGPSSGVPVGGGEIFADAQVVVTQPTKGDFRGFSSICTHQGCPVTSISNGTINCTCHGSAFSITDGSVQAGPAPRPLPTVKVTVRGGTIRTT